MSKRIDNMGNKARRYQQTKVIEHLASQYVLGTLSHNVRKRVNTLCKENELLEQRINYWQEKLVTIDQTTAAVAPHEHSWSVIADALDIDAATIDDKPEKAQSGMLSTLLDWFSSSVLSAPSYRLTTVFSLATLVIVTLMFVNPLYSPSVDNNDQLSYVAVLTEKSGGAHLVATTYGESKKLIVNVINPPIIEKQQALELWVISKTDLQARSLGVIPMGKNLIEQQLTQAQWRLIKDSDSLIVTIEEAGGSAIGEPSELVVSRGLCVRLQEWNKNA